MHVIYNRVSMDRFYCVQLLSYICLIHTYILSTRGDDNLGTYIPPSGIDVMMCEGTLFSRIIMNNMSNVSTRHPPSIEIPTIATHCLIQVPCNRSESLEFDLMAMLIILCLDALKYANSFMLLRISSGINRIGSTTLSSS